jgi:hypothetical protein
VYAAALDQAAAPPANGAPDPGRWVRLQRIIQELVDLSEQAPAFFLGLAGLRGTADPDTEHAVAVAVLVISFGHWIGLSRKRRAELGLVAMHYDNDWRAEDPPPREVTSVRHIATSERFDPESLRVALIVREAKRDHASQDQGGQPRLLAQALRFASDLDTLTRGVRGQAPLELDDAVKSLRGKSGTRYNPALLEAFLVMLRLDKAGKTKGAKLGALKLKRMRVKPGAKRG